MQEWEKISFKAKQFPEKITSQKLHVKNIRGRSPQLLDNQKNKSGISQLKQKL